MTVSSKEDIQSDLKMDLDKFLEWEEKRHHYLEIEESKIVEYRERVKEFFEIMHMQK